MILHLNHSEFKNVNFQANLEKRFLTPFGQRCSIKFKYSCHCTGLTIPISGFKMRGFQLGTSDLADEHEKTAF